MAHDARLVPFSEIERFVGRICTLLETLGLKDSQEKAVKDLARQEIYKALADGDSVVYVPGPLASVINEWSYKEHEMARSEGLPSGHDADFELTYTPKI